MPDELLEEQLKAIDLGEPAPELRASLLSTARRRQAARQRGRVLQWVLGFAAGVLVATNLIFGHVHEQRLQALTGRAAGERTLTLVDLDRDRREPSLLLLARRCEEVRWLND